MYISCSVSGCTDHFAATEPEAYELCRDIVSTYNIRPIPATKEIREPMFDADELPGLIPRTNQHTMDMHKVPPVG